MKSSVYQCLQQSPPLSMGLSLNSSQMGACQQHKTLPTLFLSFSLASNSRINPLIVHVILSLNAADPNHLRCDKVTNVNLSFYLLRPQQSKGPPEGIFLQPFIPVLLSNLQLWFSIKTVHLFHQDQLKITNSDLWRSSVEVNMAFFI